MNNNIENSELLIYLLEMMTREYSLHPVAQYPDIAAWVVYDNKTVT